MIVNRKPLCAPTHRGVEIGGFPDLRAKAKIVCVHRYAPLKVSGLAARERWIMALILVANFAERGLKFRQSADRSG
jgi:hypothetical protein